MTRNEHSGREYFAGALTFGSAWQFVVVGATSAGTTAFKRRIFFRSRERELICALLEDLVRQIHGHARRELTSAQILSAGGLPESCEAPS